MKGISAATSPIRTVKKEVDRIMDTVSSLTTPPKPTSRVPSTKKVTCPYCSREFLAGLPDNDKPILTTRCPDCNRVFTFLRPTPTPEKESAKPGKIEEPGFKEYFAFPVEHKAKEKKEEEPSFEEEWDTPETALEEGKKGGLLNIACPFCGEAFDTPAPKKKGKVTCPICDKEFQISSRGEYIAKKAKAKKAKGHFLEKLPPTPKAINHARDTIREALEGVSILKRPDKLRSRLGRLSGKAGLLLIVVAILGLLYSGVLAYNIPNMGEDTPSGKVTVSGEVLFMDDTLEGADVNLTDMGMHNQTNSEGLFLFHDVPAGDHILRASAPDKGEIVVRFTIGSKDIKQGNKDLKGLELPGNSTVTKDLRDDRPESARFMTSLLAGFVVLVSLLAFIAGLLTIQGKRFHLSLFLCGLAVFTFGFFLGSVLALIAMILIILGRKEFVS